MARRQSIHPEFAKRDVAVRGGPDDATLTRVPIALPSIGEEEVAAVAEVLESGWVTQGPKVAEFEAAFAERHGVAHALATTSCTTALHLALGAIGVGPGDEVIVPSFTWVATANVVVYCGATPVFADVDPVTCNIDVSDAAARVTERTKAIVPVHLFGLCADIDGLRAAIPEHVRIVEDAACAAGASYRGRPAGSLGDVAAFSFHPRKAVTTGEGGMIATGDARIAAHADCRRNHGASVSEEARHSGPRPWRLADFDVLGFNYRMTDIQAALGIVQLRKLDGFIAERAEGARFYSSELRKLGWLSLPDVPEGDSHAWQSYVVRVDPDAAPMLRDDIMETLQARGVATRPGTHAVHTLGYYRDRFGLRPEDFPGSLDCARNTMAIPLHNRMDDNDYVHVAACLCGLNA